MQSKQNPITQISSNLTGNYELDAKYLIAQHEIYKSHEDYEKISRSIRALMYNLIPKDKILEFKKAVNQNNFIEKALLKVETQLQKNDFNEALKIIEPLIAEVERICKVSIDDDINEFHNFDSFFEEQIYMEIFRPVKKVRQMPWRCALAYLKYGAILFELKKNDEAKNFLEKANKLNPVNTDILFELSEIYKMKDWNEYLRINNKCLEYAYSSRAIARCYRNYGFYFIEQSDYETAIALYYLSLYFDQNSKAAEKELLYISQKTGKNIKPPKFAEIEEMLKQHNMQLGPNKLIVDLAFSLSKDMPNNDLIALFT